VIYMATKYKYQGTDIAALTAKSKGEIGGGINPKNSDYKSNYSGIYNFIPYRSSGNWAAKRVSYANAYKSSSSNSVKLSNAAAWGSAPIPKRQGLSNTTSQYISTTSATITSKYTLNKPGGCSCAVVDVVAKGGNGGTASSSSRDAGGGGGAGAQASLIINFDKTGTVTFTSDSTSLKITCASQSGTITLGNGGNGGNASSSGGGAGGTGGSVSGSITGITIAWSSTGASGGAGGGGAGATGGLSNGSAGGNAPNSMTFLGTSSTITSYSGGSGGYTASYSGSWWGGGGGGASIFGSGGAGGYPNTNGTNGGAGAGGGGGWATTSSTGSAGTGGSAYIKVYYESPNSESYTVSGGTGCVFPGTMIALDKDTSIDIKDFVGGTPIDFCNPDTLEHFPQQTLNRLFYQHATKKITVDLEDGKTLSMTPNHVVLTKEGFKAYLDDYTYPKYDIGDELATIDGYKKIISIHDENIDPEMVYNIITENSLMVANGIIVAGELEYGTSAAAVGGDIEKEN
jgi:hypothetical protein